VGLGSPLGREVAPRQVGAVVAKWLARAARLPADKGRLLVACGAGAGLAAVYNVPLGGAVYTLEVVLKSFAPGATVAAIATSVIAAQIAWIGLGNERIYEVVSFDLGPSLIAWSIVAGPLFGAVGYAFARLAGVARARVPRPELLLPSCFVVFFAIGLAAMWFPQILGNGRGPAQLGFASQVAPPLAALLFALKFTAILAALGAGAHGGLLTPSLALGALMATLLGGPWSLAWAGAPAGAFAVVGATAFLASSQKMPLTAAVLMMEFTRMGHDALFPMLLAVSGAAAAREACAQWDPWARPGASKEMRAVATPQGTTEG
jgi:H+/Cl- antiporter ClcA